jgi:hypothetical protein
MLLQGQDNSKDIQGFIGLERPIDGHIGNIPQNLSQKRDSPKNGTRFKEGV